MRTGRHKISEKSPQGDKAQIKMEPQQEDHVTIKTEPSMLGGNSQIRTEFPSTSDNNDQISAGFPTTSHDNGHEGAGKFVTDSLQDDHSQNKSEAPRKQNNNGQAGPDPQQSVTLSCTLCPRTFSREKALTRHMAYHANPLTCTLCDKQFLRKCEFDRHNDRIHRKVKHFLCTICGKSYMDKSQLTIHLR